MMNNRHQSQVLATFKHTDWLGRVLSLEADSAYWQKRYYEMVEA